MDAGNTKTAERGEKNIISIKEKLKSGDYILVGIRANDNGKPSTDGIEISPKVGNVNAWLKHNDSSKMSLDCARQIYKYAKNYQMAN